MRTLIPHLPTLMLSLVLVSGPVNAAGTFEPRPLGDLVTELGLDDGSLFVVRTIEVNGTVYFGARSDEYGEELWKTDGTAAGTRLVSDGTPGPEGASLRLLGSIAGDLIYVRETAELGLALMRSDGTRAGTRALGALGGPGGDSAFMSGGAGDGRAFVLIQERGSGDFVLWSSDGTSSGTRATGTTATGVTTTSSYQSTFFNGDFVFETETDGNGRELWVSDGTAAGTRLLRDINAGSDHSRPRGLTTVAGRLYFTADDGTERMLWVTDGTPSGTELGRDDGDDPVVMKNGFVQREERLLFPVGGTPIVLNAYSTADRTVVPITSGESENDDYFIRFAFSGSALGRTYFTVNEFSDGPALWSTDGTAAGTRAEIALAEPERFSGLNAPVTAIGDRLYYAADLGDGERLYATMAGVFPGTSVLTPSEGAPVRLPIRAAQGDVVFMDGAGANAGTEPWVTDGSPAGTGLLRNIRRAKVGSDPEAFVATANGLLFVADSDGGGRELWRTDGTVGNTRQLIDLEAGEEGSFPRDLTALGTGIVFTADTSGQGRELWHTDGTSAGTAMIDIQPGSAGAGPRQLRTLGNTVYFLADDGISGVDIWAFDEPTGARRIVDIAPGSDDQFVLDIATAGDNLFWLADGSASGLGLYRHAARANQTDLLASLEDPDFELDSLLAGPDHVYFPAFDAIHGYELWASDGTVAGTARITDINPNRASSRPTPLGELDGRVLFFAHDGFSGRELWTSDRTPAGTQQVLDINPGAGNGQTAGTPQHMAIAGTLHFSANDGTHGEEVWITNGTTDGTRMVHDVFTGPQGSNPEFLARWGAKLIFAAGDATHGYEAWLTDGSADGTILAADFNVGDGNGNPGYVGIWNDQAVVAADDGSRGQEPIALITTGIIDEPAGAQGGSGGGSTGGWLLLALALLWSTRQRSAEGSRNVPTTGRRWRRLMRSRAVRIITGIRERVLVPCTIPVVQLDVSTE